MFFFFNATATTEIYTLSLHDALPIFVPGRMSEEPAQHRDRAQVRDAFHVARVVLLLEAADHEVLAAAQAHRGRAAARDHARNVEPAQRDRVGEVELADFRVHDQRDRAVLLDRRGELHLDAEGLPLDRHRHAAARRALAARDRDRELAAGVEAGLLTAARDQRRMG